MSTSPPPASCSDDRDRGKTPVKVATIVGTRPELIKLARVIHELDRVRRARARAHRPELRSTSSARCSSAISASGNPTTCSMSPAGTLGETIGNVIARSYAVLETVQPDALLLLGDTNSCLSAISAKRLKIPHLPHGGREPLLRRARARGGQPPDRGSHERRQPRLHRARAPLPARRGPASGDRDQDRLADAGGARTGIGQESSPPTCSVGSGSRRDATSW